MKLLLLLQRWFSSLLTLPRMDIQLHCHTSTCSSSRTSRSFGVPRKCNESLSKRMLDDSCPKPTCSATLTTKGSPGWLILVINICIAYVKVKWDSFFWWYLQLLQTFPSKTVIFLRAEIHVVLKAKKAFESHLTKRKYWSAFPQIFLPQSD